MINLIWRSNMNIEQILSLKEILEEDCTKVHGGTGVNDVSYFDDSN